MINRSVYVTGLLLIFLFSACEKHIEHVHEEENINEVYIIFRDLQQNEYRFSYIDVDGDGPIPAQITTDTLPNQTILEGNVRLVNSLQNPHIDITEEIREEADDHQFFYQLAGKKLDGFAYIDKDHQNLPLGLVFHWQTSHPETTTFHLILRHLPNKKAPGVELGNIDQAGGETDVHITFPIVIK